MKIELATTHHLNGVTKLFNDYREFYQQPPDISGAKVFIEQRLAKKDSVIFVATDGDDINKSSNDVSCIGFAQLYPTFSSVSMKRQYVLNDLYVSPDERKQGIGSALLEHAQHFAANEEGCKGLALTTAKDNLVAQSLYERFNFEKDEEFFHYAWTVPLSELN